MSSDEDQKFGLAGNEQAAGYEAMPMADPVSSSDDLPTEATMSEDELGHFRRPEPPAPIEREYITIKLASRPLKTRPLPPSRPRTTSKRLASRTAPPWKKLRKRSCETPWTAWIPNSRSPRASNPNRRRCRQTPRRRMMPRFSACYPIRY